MTSTRTSQAVEQVLQEALKVGSANTLLMSASSGQAIAEKYQRMEETLQGICERYKERGLDPKKLVSAGEAISAEAAARALEFDPLTP